MKYIYACLAGEWKCLNNDPNCVMGKNFQQPSQWLREGAPIETVTNKTGETYHEMDYVMIHFEGVDYHINPIFIQVVTK